MITIAGNQRSSQTHPHSSPAARGGSGPAKSPGRGGWHGQRGTNHRGGGAGRGGRRRRSSGGNANKKGATDDREQGSTLLRALLETDVFKKQSRQSTPQQRRIDPASQEEHTNQHAKAKEKEKEKGKEKEQVKEKEKSQGWRIISGNDKKQEEQSKKEEQQQQQQMQRQRQKSVVSSSDVDEDQDAEDVMSGLLIPSQQDSQNVQDLQEQLQLQSSPPLPPQTQTQSQSQSQSQQSPTPIQLQYNDGQQTVDIQMHDDAGDMDIESEIMGVERNNDLDAATTDRENDSATTTKSYLANKNKTSGRFSRRNLSAAYSARGIGTYDQILSACSFKIANDLGSFLYQDVLDRDRLTQSAITGVVEEMPATTTAPSVANTTTVTTDKEAQQVNTDNIYCKATITPQEKRDLEKLGWKLIHDHRPNENDDKRQKFVRDKRLNLWTRFPRYLDEIDEPIWTLQDELDALHSINIRNRRRKNDVEQVQARLEVSSNQEVNGKENKKGGDIKVAGDNNDDDEEEDEEEDDDDDSNEKDISSDCQDINIEDEYDQDSEQEACEQEAGNMFRHSLHLSTMGTIRDILEIVASFRQDNVSSSTSLIAGKRILNEKPLGWSDIMRALQFLSHDYNNNGADNSNTVGKHAIPQTVLYNTLDRLRKYYGDPTSYAFDTHQQDDIMEINSNSSSDDDNGPASPKNGDFIKKRRRPRRSTRTPQNFEFPVVSDSDDSSSQDDSTYKPKGKKGKARRRTSTRQSSTNTAEDVEDGESSSLTAEREIQQDDENEADQVKIEQEQPQQNRRRSRRLSYIKPVTKEDLLREIKLNDDSVLFTHQTMSGWPGYRFTM